MMLKLLLILAAALLSASLFRSDVFNPIQLRSASDAARCRSWRLTVETHNRQGRGQLVPESCVSYVREYMTEGQYREDGEEVASVAVEYAKSVKATADGKDVWVFDVDETLLSNLPYYQRPDVQYGSIASNITVFFDEWVVKGVAPVVPGMLDLYNTIKSLGFKIVIVTGSPVRYNDIRMANLKKVGYVDWHDFISNGADYDGISTTVFKSDQRTKLVKGGYIIVGNVGDQWSDISGDNVGTRAFKVPNPMYYS